MLVANHYSVRWRCHNDIFQSVAEYGDTQFIYGVCILVVVSHHNIADMSTRQFLAQGVPCAKVLPLASERNNGYWFCFFSDFIIETDFWEFGIAFVGFLKCVCFEILINNIHHIAKTECEHAAIPISSLLKELLRFFLIGFFGEAFHHLNAFRRFRFLWYYITEFLARVCRSYAHQYKVGNVILYGLYHLTDCSEISWFGINITRHYNYDFVIATFLFFSKIACCKGDSRECITTFRFGYYTDIFSQLVDDAVTLYSIRSECNVIGKLRLTYLTHNSLYHWFHTSVGWSQQGQKLLAASVIT